MTPATDPYVILGLSRGASLDEVKRAYRRLAKAYHPDSGERNVARFLAIQAAYEQLEAGLDPTSGSHPATPGSTAARRPWQADPDRSESTRRAYGGRSRTSARTGGAARTTGSANRSTGRARRGPDPGPGPGGSPPDGPQPSASQTKATPGSTSYDGADSIPFEPDWGGASWYGTTSGTYWTLNPKEYADPRKHGPEYQARARRAARGRPADGSDGSAGSTSGPANVDPDPARDPSHTTSSWWESTAGAGQTAEQAEGREAPHTTGSATRPAPITPPDGATPPDLGRALSDIGRALTDEHLGGLRGRLGRALIGWLPIALGIGWLVGELTGCGRFAATCDGSAGPIALGLQLAVFAALVLVPALGTISAMAAIAVLAVSLVAALILSANTGGPDDTRRTTLGVLLVVGWLVGAAIAVRQRLGAGRRPASPVS
jgi:DnaJ domain